MAKESSIRKNNKRKALIEKESKKREKLRSILKNTQISFKDRFDAQRKLSELSRNSSSVRYRNRCGITGRPRGFVGNFNMSRIMLRHYASFGLIPGLRKSSW
jgi:small subunit ribosomal protein S14